MASEKTMAAFRAVQEHLRRNNFSFKAEEEKLRIHFTVNGDPTPITVVFHFRDEQELMQIFCYLRRIPEGKRMETTIAVAHLNSRFVNGLFDYDISDGEIRFRVSQKYNTDLTDDLIRYLLSIAFNAANKYNDLLFMLGKDMITMEQFIEKAEN
jgi:hypothetical protein